MNSLSVRVNAWRHAIENSFFSISLYYSVFVLLLCTRVFRNMTKFRRRVLLVPEMKGKKKSEIDWKLERRAARLSLNIFFSLFFNEKKFQKNSHGDPLSNVFSHFFIATLQKIKYLYRHKCIYIKCQHSSLNKICKAEPRYSAEMFKSIDAWRRRW